MAIHSDFRLLVGGFCDGSAGESEVPAGLAVHHVHADGTSSVEGVLALENPTWAAQGASADLFYVSHSGKTWLSAVRLLPGGGLELVDRIEIGAVNPAHLIFDAAANAVVASCFTEGVILRVSLKEDGTFGEIVTRWDANNQAPEATRRNSLQTEAEPHQSVRTLGGYFVSDRAQDVVWLAADNGELRVAATLRPGSGPRHMALHPSGRHAYLAGELDNTLITFRREGDALQPVDVVSTLPRDFFGDSAVAAIDVDAERERVYVSNRGHDSMAVFDIAEPESPRLIGWIPVQGRTPRYAGLLPQVDALAMAAQDSDVLHLMEAADAAQAQGERITLRHAGPSFARVIDAAL